MTEQQMEHNNYGELLSLNDLAEYLSCSRTFAANLVSDGTIPSFKIGTLRRVRKADLDDYIESRIHAGN